MKPSAIADKELDMKDLILSIAVWLLDFLKDVLLIVIGCYVNKHLDDRK